MPKYYLTVRQEIRACVEAKDKEDAYEAYHDRNEVLWSDVLEEETMSIEEEKDEQAIHEQV
jgi:hypothetical protein